MNSIHFSNVLYLYTKLRKKDCIKNKIHTKEKLPGQPTQRKETYQNGPSAHLNGNALCMADMESVVKKFLKGLR